MADEQALYRREDDAFVRINLADICRIRRRSAIAAGELYPLPGHHSLPRRFTFPCSFD